MNDGLRAALERAIGEATNEPSPISTARPLGGGCINNAQLLQLEDGRSFFVKSNSQPPSRFFSREAQGLQALGEVGVLRVPRVIACVEDDVPAPFLVLEAIVPGERDDDFFELFGRRFAEHHQKARGERFGFRIDNYLGSTPQPNRFTDDWCEFWRRQRLGYQLDLARRSGQSDPELDRLGGKLLDRLDQFLATPDEPPALLHGDLWAGNFLVDEAGQPVLIDPAVYYGRREADLAMTLLFGGFESRFYKAYEEVWPLAPGSSERLEIYKLYHLLNHLNLFGGGYRSGCLRILRRFV